MKKVIFAITFCMACVFVLPAFSFAEVTRDEVINETARLTGLSKDALELVYQEAPSLFAGVEQAAFTVKVVHLFANARDDNAVLELFNRFADTLRTTFLPGPLNTFFTAIKAYKTSLEVIRDYVFIPSLKESIYRNYRSSRLIDWKRGDKSTESISTAFEMATMGRFSGYYEVKESMYQELVRAKGYNQDLIGPKLENYLRSQIDQFWKDTLELRFQREMLTQNESAITAKIWETIAGDLERIRRRAMQRPKAKVADSNVSPPATPRESTPDSETSPTSTEPDTEFFDAMIPDSAVSTSSVTSSSLPEEPETPEEILAAFRAVYPAYLRWWHHEPPLPRIELLANAEPVGDGKYRLAYRLWRVVEDGPHKGEEYVALDYEIAQTLEEIKDILKYMKEKLK
ncbi:MAG: peptide/nickel transport system substrate-binding protein [Candidatus Atribacteria bacterium]|nr:peptide/nickel transport system substrate-binding protein [Candidatus Atribacteria bacterium]